MHHLGQCYYSIIHVDKITELLQVIFFFSRNGKTYYKASTFDIQFSWPTFHIFLEFSVHWSVLESGQNFFCWGEDMVGVMIEILFCWQVIYCRQGWFYFQSPVILPVMTTAIGTLLKKFKGAQTLWQIAVKTDIPSVDTKIQKN